MKIKTVKEELKQLPIDQLELKLDELRRELLTLRLQSATTNVKSFSSQKGKLRYAIACGLTFLKQKKAPKA